MRKALVVAAVVIGIGVLVRRVGLPRVDWEQRFERLPDNAPPKWMYRNISAIRDNTDRILAMLEREDRPAGSA